MDSNNDEQKLLERIRQLEKENLKLSEELQKSKENTATLLPSFAKNCLSSTSVQDQADKFPAEDTNNTKLKKSSTKPKTRNLYYEKRKGVVNNGKEYECLMCALYALKFSTHENIVDFKMTTNNNNCGDFDDIEIEATFLNGKTCTYLFQLKHKDNKDLITVDQLTKEFFQRNKKQEKSKFYLPGYLKSMSDLISKFKKKNKNVIFILYTNSPVEIENGSILSFKSYNSLEVEECSNMENKDLLMNSETGNCIFRFKMEINNSETLPEAAELWKNFYFFINQIGIKSVKPAVENYLKKLVQCDVFVVFGHFMREFWSKNFILTKNDVITKLTEFTFSPHIKALSGRKSNQKTQELKEIIMKFDLTLVESSQEDTITNIWPEVEEQFDWDSSNSFKFQVTESETSDIQKSKKLWHLSTVPLILNVANCKLATIENVLSLLQTSSENKRIVLICDEKDKFRNLFSNIFCTLSNLIPKCEEEQSFGKLIKNLRVSFQEKESICLERLLAVDRKFSEIIGIEELLEMSQQDSLVIGSKKILPEVLIPRLISALCININDILKDEIREGCVIIINCDETFRVETLTSRNVNVVEISKYLQEENFQKYEDYIVVTSSTCTNLQFDKVCEKSQNVYLLQAYDKENCILLLRKGNQQTIENRFIKKDIEENQILEYLNNPVNVFCAPPGMGKSTLAKFLYNNCPTDSWAIFIDLINYNGFLASNPKVETIWLQFLHQDENNNFIKRVKTTLLNNKKMYIFLDGLDEVDCKYVKLVMDFVKYASLYDCKIWIFSRENLHETILCNLKAVPLEIKELSQEQQKKYIYEKLKNRHTSEEIKKIVSAVFNSADINNSQELLGIPLQLHILTETFLNNEEAYKNLEEENIFRLTQMYRLFFEGKKKTALKKVGVDEHQESQLGFSFDHQLEQYEIPALQSCLDASDFTNLDLNITSSKRFIHQIKINGDKHAIVRNITENEEAIFDHQTYAEYFASVWFKKNLEKVVLLREKLFTEKYENLRLIFDIMMAENNPLHLAVIYKNFEQFNKHINCINDKDEGGRSVQHLACSYGMKYPKVGKKMNRESVFYLKMMKILFNENSKVDECCKLYGFNCLNYSLQSKCLYPVEKMLEERLINFTNLKNLILIYYDVETLAYYSAQFGYHHLLEAVLENDPELIKKEIWDEYLLQSAVSGCKDDTSVFKRNGNVKAAEILIKRGADLNQLFKQNFFRRENMTVLDYVCQNKWFDMFQMLVDSGAECAEGNSVLHRITQYHTVDDGILKILDGLNIDVNVQNQDGKTALHLVCENGHFESARNLIGKGTKADIVDHEGNNALHFACDALKENTEIVDLLISTETLNIDAKNSKGVTPLHLASLNGHFQTIKMLLEKQADPDIVDDFKKTALHYATQSRKENTEVVNLLTDYGTDVNAKTTNGITALHLACKHGHVGALSTLLEKTVDVNVEDNDLKNALHFACLAQKQNLQIINLLLEKNININGQNKSGTTPLQFACKNGHEEIVKRLLEKQTDINILDCDNRNALHYAYQSLKENKKIVQMLLNCNLNVNVQDNCGRTALHLACRSGQVEIVKKLLEMGANTDILDHDKKNVLHLLCQSFEESTEIINLLLERNVNLNFQDKNGQTPLHLACLNGHISAVKILLENGSCTEILDNNGNNSLHFACRCREENVSMIDLLLDYKIDVDARNEFEMTPLHVASETAHVKCVNKLLEKGADVSSVDKNGNSALHFACQSRKENTKIIDLLLNRGLNVNSQNNFGETPLHLASQIGKGSNVENLLTEGANANVIDNSGKNVFEVVAQFWGENSEIMNLLKYK